MGILCSWECVFVYSMRPLPVVESSVFWWLHLRWNTADIWIGPVGFGRLQREEWPHPNKSLTHCPATNSDWHFRDTQALKNKLRFLWASVDKIALLFSFLFLLKWHHCPIKEKLIKAIRVPTVMDNLGYSGNLINFKIISKEWIHQSTLIGSS